MRLSKNARGVALVVALLALGAWLLQPLSPEARFALSMIPHHAQAVAMAQQLPAQDPNLEFFAQDVAQTQAAQIEQMRRWLPLWRQPFISSSTTPEMAVAMGMASAEEMAKLGRLKGREAETFFLQLMIRHHQGALPMIEQALNQIQGDSLARRLIEAMGNSQSGEIKTMEAWLADRGGQKLDFSPAPMPTHNH